MIDKLFKGALLLVVFLAAAGFLWQTYKRKQLQRRYRNAITEYQIWLDRRDRREIEYWRRRAQRHQLEAAEAKREKGSWEFCGCGRYFNQDCFLRFSDIDKLIPYKQFRGNVVAGYGGRNARSYFVAWRVGTKYPDHWLNGRGADSQAPRSARDIVCADPLTASRWVGSP